MPTIVDHDRRRLEIAAAVGRLVAAGGVQSVTIRATAKEAGFSPAVIGHYFENKEDLLTFSYLSARSRTSMRVERALLAGKSVFQCIKECLPTDMNRRADWLVWFGHWGMNTDKEAHTQERRQGLEDSASLFERVLKAAQNRGELPERLNTASLAIRLMIFVDGIACIAVQAPDEWPAKRQESALKTEIDALMAAAQG